MIEGNARKQYGGIWKAPKYYTFMCMNTSQHSTILEKRYGDWQTVEGFSYMNRLPWLGTAPVLLTTYDGSANWWGTLIQSGSPHFGVGPLINQITPTTKVFYWVREQVKGKENILLKNQFM